MPINARPARLLPIAVIVAGSFSAFPAASAAAGAGENGTAWTLQAVNIGRTCSLKLRFDSAGAAGSLSIPAGCRQAIPAVRKALTWSIGPASQISFEAEDRQNLLTFTRQADGTWQATATDGNALMLTPSGQSAVAAADTTAPAEGADVLPAQQPAAGKTRGAKAANGPGSSQDLAGRYAVLRGDRDTGCMVTLDTTRGRDGPRARLSPACRDQGITIFDPVNWHAKGTEIVLTARKGHSVSLDKDENGTWVKLPKDAKALALKPL